MLELVGRGRPAVLHPANPIEKRIHVEAAQVKGAVLRLPASGKGREHELLVVAENDLHIGQRPNKRDDAERVGTAVNHVSKNIHAVLSTGRRLRERSVECPDVPVGVGRHVDRHAAHPLVILVVGPCRRSRRWSQTSLGAATRAFVRR